MAAKTSLISERAITLLLLILAFSTTAHAKIIYVDNDAPADFNNIQAAIDDSNNGDVVIVFPGTYTGDGNRDIDFCGKAITVRSIDPNDPNIVAATIIDCNGSSAEPHRGFYFHSAEDANSILSGLTITNGYAYTGGGIYCEWGPPPPPTPPPTPPPLVYSLTSPTITNYIISGNSGKHGGGTYYQNSRPTISNCTISGNTAEYGGGGIYCGCQPVPPPHPLLAPAAVGSQSAPEILAGYNLAGPTITNCIFSGNSADWGGGMFNLSSNLTIANCIFSKNSADLGGGMDNGWSIKTTLDNCTFSGNSADWGGGMCNFSSNLTIVNCTFRENTADLGGGMCNFLCNPTIVNCIFSRNSANDDGGGIYNHDSSTKLTNCTFTENSALGGGVWRGDGGGMCNEGFWASQIRPILTNCTFNGNSADYGGGMYNGGSNATLTNCTFSGNSAIEYGGGMCNYESSPTLINCTFNENWAIHRVGTIIFSSFSYMNMSGGGMFNLESSPTVTNCRFSGNWAERNGAGMYNERSSPKVTNCTFSGNKAWSQHGGGGIHNGSGCNPTLTNCILWGDTPAEIYTHVYSTITISYSDIQGSWPGEGNIFADPCFLQLGYWNDNNTPYYWDDYWIEGDFHLLPDSPCINAGNPNYIAESNETDLDGNPRVIGCRIDIGAFEHMKFVPAEARIVPRTINLASQGKWITYYIQLPEAYNVVDIGLCVVLLENEIEPEQLSFNDKKQIVIAKFSREEVQDILDIGEVELTISVQLMDATYFEGTDLIRVIYEGGGKLAELGEATNPNPADSAMGVDINADLSWTAGSEATSHDVYFGTTSPPPFVCNQLDTIFDPGKMPPLTKYFWRIDEVNKWNKTTGQIWSFTTMLPPPPPPPPP